MRSGDEAAADRLLAALEEDGVRSRRSKEVWKQGIERSFAGVRKEPAREWAHGCRDRGEEARGARG